MQKINIVVCNYWQDRSILAYGVSLWCKVQTVYLITNAICDCCGSYFEACVRLKSEIFVTGMKYVQYSFTNPFLLLESVMKTRVTYWSWIQGYWESPQSWWTCRTQAACERVPLSYRYWETSETLVLALPAPRRLHAPCRGWSPHNCKRCTTVVRKIETFLFELLNISLNLLIMRKTLVSSKLPSNYFSLLEF